MKRKTIFDLITSIILILCSSAVMLFPLFNISNIKLAFLIVMTVYIVSNLINYALVKKTKDKEGLLTVIICMIATFLLLIIDISTKPLNLAIIILIWIFGMSLVKLKKADYYHDRKNNLWISNMVSLFIFVLIGLLTVINLYYSKEVRILLIGSFFFVNGVLDAMDPLMNYIKETK